MKNANTCILSTISHQTPHFSESLADELGARLRCPFVVLCLGTDKDIADSLGPLTGHFLSCDEDFPFPVAGTLSNPVHNENLRFHLDILRHKYPKHGLLVIDAAKGNSCNIGDILLLGREDTARSNGIQLKITEAELTLLGICDHEGSAESWMSSIRLHTVYEMAKAIAEAVSLAARWERAGCG